MSWSWTGRDRQAHSRFAFCRNWTKRDQLHNPTRPRNNDRKYSFATISKATCCCCPWLWTAAVPTNHSSTTIYTVQMSCYYVDMEESSSSINLPTWLLQLLSIKTSTLFWHFSLELARERRKKHFFFYKYTKAINILLLHSPSPHDNAVFFHLLIEKISGLAELKGVLTGCVCVCVIEEKGVAICKVEEWSGWM